MKSVYKEALNHYRLPALPLLAVTLAAVLYADRGYCALLENIGISIVSMSLGNAVTADPPSVVDAVYFNPAGLSNFEGRWITGSITGLDFDYWSSYEAPEGYSIGGFKDDPVAGKKSGSVQALGYIPGFGDSVSLESPFALPSSFGVSYRRPGSRWTFATAIYPEMVGGVSKDDGKDDPSRYFGREGTLQRIAYLSPSVSLQVTDTLSIGLSVPISHTAMVGETDVRLANPLLGIIGTVQGAWCPESGGNPLDFVIGLCGGLPEGEINPLQSAGTVNAELTSSADVTFNLGVLWEPYDWLAFGGVYRSGSDTILTGDVDVVYEPWVTAAYNGLNSGLAGTLVKGILGWPSTLPDKESVSAELKLPYPQRVQAGLKIKPVPSLQINFDVSWADWDKWNEFTFKFDRPIEALKLYELFSGSPPTEVTVQRGYKSEFHYGLGVQYRVNDQLTLRAGFEPRKSSIPDDKRDALAIAPDLDFYSLGFGYRTRSGLQIDVGAGYADGSYDVPANTSCNLNCDDLLNFNYNPYAGLDVEAGLKVFYIGLTASKQF